MLQVIVQKSMEHKEILNNIQSGGRVCPERARIGYQHDQPSQISIKLMNRREWEDRSIEGLPVMEFLGRVFVEDLITFSAKEGITLFTCHRGWAVHVITT